jgi:AcrR family transcriptional regulator
VSTASATARTRPRNRRETILVAAADLFAESGYHNVSTEEIARTVGIGASALYRHVRNKSDLLEASLIAEFESVRRDVDDAHPRDIGAAIGVLAAAFSRRRQMGLLWSREMRHLDEPARRRAREPFFHVYGELFRLLRAEGRSADAELTVIAVIAVLTSQSYHRAPLAPERVAGLLAGMARAVTATSLAAPGAVEAEPRDGVTSATRSLAIMNAATHLFSVHGYQSVTMQDIGDAVGATSASLYKHYPTKGDLLTAIMTRATEALHVGLNRALASAGNAQEALHATVGAYVEFAIHHVDLLGVLVTELPNIPEPARHGLRRDQAAYVGEWVALLGAARPDLDRTEVRFRVQAALTVVNDSVRTSRLRRHPGLAANIASLAESVLWS